MIRDDMVFLRHILDATNKIADTPIFRCRYRRCMGYSGTGYPGLEKLSD